MPRFSASKSSLLAHCRYPFREGVEWRDWPITKDSGSGRALHRCSERRIEEAIPHGADLVGDAAAEFDVKGEIPRLLRIWAHMERWLVESGVDMMRAEVKIAADLAARSAREIDLPGDRNYGELRPSEVPMSIDLILMRPDEIPRFRDWKTGHHATGYWPQIGTNAIGFAWWLEAKHPEVWARFKAVEGGILHATEEGVDASRVRPFDRFDLAAMADDLAMALDEARVASPKPGDHCTELRCGAFGLCPETLHAVDRIKDLVPANDNIVPATSFQLSTEILGADHAAWAMQQLRTFKAYARQVEDAIERFVGDQEHGLTTGDLLRKTFREMARVSTAELIALARSKGATDEEIAGCTHMNRESNGIRVVRRPGHRAA